jgi:hypothetical protein
VAVRPTLPMSSTELTSRYGLNDIRALVGHKVDLGQVKTAAAVRLGEADRL